MSVLDRREERRRRRRRRERLRILAAAGCLVLALGIGAGGFLLSRRGEEKNTAARQETMAAGQPETAPQAEDGRSAEEVLNDYMALLAQGDYTGMYELLDSASQDARGRNEFVERNGNIYGGIEVKNITFNLIREVSVKVQGHEGESGKVESTSVISRSFSYTQSMDSLAGPISFDNEATLHLENGSWRLAWDDSLIFPDLTEGGRVRITSTPASRGRILDRYGTVLAGTGAAVSVGLVKGRMQADSVAALAAELGITVDSIEQKMSAGWVTDDVFVPIKTVAVDEGGSRDERLRAIPGVQLNEAQVRVYPLGEAAAHLTGYVQNITAEELAADTEGYYNSNSMVGKVGLEALYEERLRGTPGRRIRIQSDNGDTVKILAASNPVQGEDIILTIDANLQRRLYQVYQADPAANVAMNPYTGEVLALVSTPSYDPNLFIQGLSQEVWDSWVNDPFTPMTNRFRAAWTPGSSFKSVIAAIGLTNGTIEAGESYPTSEAWQAGESWGAYRVTTLHTASPGTVEQALVVSDNVWFARAAVRMGAEALENACRRIGFEEQMPFPIQMKSSSFSNSGMIESEIMLADSGYGQGEVQINPLHLASIYSAFLNEGSMIRPQLERRAASAETSPEQESVSEDDGWDVFPVPEIGDGGASDWFSVAAGEPSFWKENVFSADACSRIVRALTKAVESGTGTRARVDGLTIAGKTGTAEIKQSQEDITGTELGWFAAFTPDLPRDEALLLVTMVEDVKNLGGSGYVTQKNGAVFSWYCLGNNLDTLLSQISDRDELEAEAGWSLTGQDYGLQWDEDIDEQELGMIDEEDIDWQELGMIDEEE